MANKLEFADLCWKLRKMMKKMHPNMVFRCLLDLFCFCWCFFKGSARWSLSSWGTQWTRQSEADAEFLAVDFFLKSWRNQWSLYVSVLYVENFGKSPFLMGKLWTITMFTMVYQYLGYINGISMNQWYIYCWLVVFNMTFEFSISYMGCHPSHWRTDIFQDG